jgi:N6-adenosine-specific RNA methylase IME4/ParB-like chromosome segregation protein Spo0J
MKAHPYADILPLLEGEAFDALVADIRANGLLEPITIHEGLILDGRNRHRACEAAGIEPRFLEFDGDDPLAFVLSLNLHRRHLSESQRSLVASRLANMRQGERTDLQPSANLRKVSQAEAAGRLNVSERSVTFAALVDKEATPALIHAVEQGKIAVSLAAKLATAPGAIQRQAVAEPGRAHVVVKQAARAERESELATKQLTLPATRFGVVYADPPWRFEVYSRDTGLDRDASNHYPVMTREKIRALDVASFAAPDCVLFLWATAPMLEQALETLKAWGFAYKTHFVWAKDRAGTGYWARNKHELLLVGTRGSIPAPAPGTQLESLIEAPVGEHSAKPEAFAEMIERLFPTLPKIELFARGEARPGWDAGGTRRRDPRADDRLRPGGPVKEALVRENENL